MDNIAQLHESFRTAPMPPELADLQKAMLPMAELCSEEEAHRFTRGLALAHFDAVLRLRTEAHGFLEGELGPSAR
jgi:hypothetical protein